MSESTFQELDLDNLGDPNAAAPADIEIVDEGVEQAPPEETPAPAPKPAAEQDDDDGDEPAGTEAPQERRRLTRSQRLKAQRDHYAQQVASLQEEVQDLRQKAQRSEADSVEAANIGLDFYIQTIDSNIKALRREFDLAFDAGDRDKIFEVQQRMAELAADKKQAEREKRAIPQKAAPQSPSGQAAPPQTRQTAEPTPTPTKASPAAKDWAARNKNWFNVDQVMTAAAFAIDREMVAEGFEPSDPDYFDELDKRVQRTFPHKFGQQEAAAAPAARATPTIQSRGQSMPSSGKVKVVITAEDRRMADHLGLDIQTYAREKAKRERALQGVSQYTEIL